MAKKRKSSSSKPHPDENNSKKFHKKDDTLSSSEEEEEEEDDEQIVEENDTDEEESQNDDESSEDEASRKEALKELLQPFSKDQIIEFLQFAAIQDKNLMTRIIQTAESDPAHRKLFVHGLGWDCTTDQVVSTFSQFGEIEDCKVPTDKATGRVKGFAFILYKTRDAAQKALKDKQKKIGNRMTSCQLASAGSPGVANAVNNETSGRKIFVANVASHVDPEALKLFFENFGEIEDGPLGLDSVSGKFKGFSMFVYKTVEGCKKALEEPVKLFENCRLECRLAVENFKNNKNANQARVLSNVSPGFGGSAQSDIGGNMNYNVGVNPAFYANSAAAMMGQNPGFGLANPMMVSSLNQTGLATSVGASPQFGGNYGINTVSPSVIASYAAQSTLQGLGAYQAQAGNSSAGSPAAAAARSQSTSFGSTGQSFPSYFRR